MARTRNTVVAAMAAAILLAILACETPPPVHDPEQIQTFVPPSVVNLSDQDRTCLPDNADTDQAVTDFIAQAPPEATDRLIRCLSPDGRAEVLMLTGQAPLLSPAERECVIPAVAALEATDPAAAAVIVGIGLVPFDAAMVGAAVTAYCTRDRAVMPTGSAGNPVPNERVRKILICLVDRAGDSGNFVEQNPRDSNVELHLDEAMAGHGNCAHLR